jgi:hypothetical protein
MRCTPDARQLFPECRFEFALRDTIFHVIGLAQTDPRRRRNGGATHRDRIRSAWGMCHLSLCTARIDAAVLFPGRQFVTRNEEGVARTTHIFFRSSMTSRGDDCTDILWAYFTAFASMLPTREVKCGRPRFPGGGCVMSAPDRPSV